MGGIIPSFILIPCESLRFLFAVFLLSGSPLHWPKEFDPSIYVLCLSLATHVRVPPPFGQVPPLLDVFIV